MRSSTDPKIVQLVKLISILAHGDALSAVDLADQLGVSKSTVYRYLENLKQGGLPGGLERRIRRVGKTFGRNRSVGNRIARHTSPNAQ